MNLLKATSHYGDQFYISRKDYEQDKKLLKIFLSDGSRALEAVEYKTFHKLSGLDRQIYSSVKAQGSGLIHRENILYTELVEA